MLIKKYHIILVFLLINTGFVSLFAQDLDSLKIVKQLDFSRDSIRKLKKKTSSSPRSVLSHKELVKKDTITLDSIPVKKPKEALADIIEHSADDSIQINLLKDRTTLYNNAKLHYQDVDLQAGVIVIDYKKNLIFAKGIKDSTGYKQLPVFKQGQETSTQDSLLVNYNTERALIWGLTSEQDNGVIVNSSVSKKVNDSTIYVRDIQITTSKKKVKDYYIGIKKAKVVPNKKIIAGTSQLVIADVPTPVILPFAYFPLTQTRTSGILMPTWGETAQKGYFLQNGGYYLAISDYFDLALTGDIYSNGSWGFRAQSNYALRYKFSGNFSYSYDNNIYSLRGFDDYSKSTNYNIRWSHTQAATANPNARLSASVNLGSSKYYRESLNEYSNNSFLNNQLSSSISFSKRFVGTPFNLSVSATHTQTTSTEAITMSLPSLQLSMDRIYPFVSKTGAKKNALQRLGLSYNMEGNYRFTTTDQDFFTKKMFKNGQSGVKHTVAVNTNMKLFHYFTVNPTANYKETWYFDYISKQYDANQDAILSDTLNRFKALREYSTGVSLSTNVYGTFKFKKGRLKAIRHTIRPSISYSYRPDFSFYDESVYNPDTQEIESYSPYVNGIYSVPGKGISNSIGISVNNTLEAKVMSKDSTQTVPKKINLLNNLNFNTNYNIAADTLRWSPVSMNAGTQFFNNKMRLNINASLDPYAINANGNRINTFNIDNGGSLFRLTRAGVTMSYGLSDKTFHKKEDDDKQNNQAHSNRASENMLGGDLNNSGSNNDTDKKKKKITKLYYAKMPWSLNLSYSLQYSNVRREHNISNNSLMFNGDIELSPKWNVGFNSGYDFKRKGITYTQLHFQRDLDSWKMSFNWVPFGSRTSYYFFIGVKSAVLSDLKYDKRSLPDKRLF